MGSRGLARIAHVRHWRQKGPGCQVLSAFSALLVMSGDKLDFYMPLGSNSYAGMVILPQGSS